MYFQYFLSIYFFLKCLHCAIHPDPQRKLADEIRKVVLENYPAESFIWTLLKLVYEADCCFGKKAPLLSRYFSAQEFLEAKEKVKTLVSVNVEDGPIMSPDSESTESFELQIVGKNSIKNYQPA